jgi:hypothetical protein
MPEARPPRPPAPERPREWQGRFDHGRQPRYLPDRASVPRYVLAVGPHAASPRFEVFAERLRGELGDGP